MDPNNWRRNDAFPPGGIPLDELLEEIARREQEAYMFGVRQAREYYNRVAARTGGAAAEAGYVANLLSSFTNFFRCIPGYVSRIRDSVLSREPEPVYTYRDAVYQATAQTIAVAKNSSNPAARDAARTRIETGVTITLLRKIIRELIENYDAIHGKISPAARQKIVREIFKRTLYLIHYMNEHHAAIADMIVALSTAPQFHTHSVGANSSTSSQNVFNSTNSPVTVLTDIVIQHMNALVSDAEYAGLAAEYLLVANPDAGKLPTIRGGADVEAKIAEIEAGEVPAGVEERCPIQDYSERITGVTGEQKQAYTSTATSAANRNVRGAFGAIADRSATEIVMDGLSAAVTMASDAMLSPVRNRFFPPQKMFPSTINIGRRTAATAPAIVDMAGNAAVVAPNGNATGVGMLVAAPGGPPNAPNGNGAAVVANVPRRAPKRGRNNGENGNANTGRGNAIARVEGNANIAGPTAPNGNAVAEGGARRRRSHKKTQRKRRVSKKTRSSRRR
jgi:hypothetical protein